MAQNIYDHPDFFLGYVMFRDHEPDGAVRTCTTLPPGRVDRSPCGTGSSANLAALFARGLVKSRRCPPLSVHHRRRVHGRGDRRNGNRRPQGRAAAHHRPRLCIRALTIATVPCRLCALRHLGTSGRSIDVSETRMGKLIGGLDCSRYGGIRRYRRGNRENLPRKDPVPSLSTVA